MELIAIFAPLFAFLIIGFFGARLGDRISEIIACAMMLASVFASIALFIEVDILGKAYVKPLATWLVSGDLSIDWSLRIDQLTVIMMCVVNIVSTCVHFYSIGYMHGDPHKPRFMAYLSLFTFAMLILVTSNNLLQLFFGWEAVGLSSYLLIGFWNERASANAAAQKAFVVNRIGDFGLILGILACYMVFGTLNFDEIFPAVASKKDEIFTFLGHDFNALFIIGMLLFVGAVGKSAQLGLHTWLPDAMEGPTPVSALIHAATMVTAGIFLIVRFSPLYEYAPDALVIISVFGALTAFVAATIGVTQFDIKRVIAYSTMSQLGYMFFAVGVSAYGAAMFHLVTHAFFKALLFLGAGSVIHAMGGEQDMRRMGGLWKKIPMTYGLMWVGALALGGIPPFSGFYSKDIVLEAIWASNTTWANIAFWMVIFAAFQTAFYSWRMLLMTFHGAPRGDMDAHDHAHESPPTMMVPMILLALGAIFSGMFLYDAFVGAGGHGKQGAVNSVLGWINPELAYEWSKDKFWQGSIFVLPENDTVYLAHYSPLWVKRMPLVVAIVGIVLVYVMYMWKPWLPEKFRIRFPFLYKLSLNKWYFDEIYDFVFVKNSFRLGRFFWIAGDKNTIDRLGPDGSAFMSGVFARVLSRFQTGFIYQYAFVMMAALVAIMSWFFWQFMGTP